MDARVCRLYGRNDIRIETAPVGAPGPGEVLVTLGAGGICGSDLHYYQNGGFGPIRVREPIILGHEASGTVLALGARVRVTDTAGSLAQTPDGWVPRQHLRALGDWRDDPVSVAESLIGSPYLWGGNSRSGIDCSGLVQVAYFACGRACPGDSDLQMAGLGTALPATEPLRRGDLLFWKGHVALVCDGDRLIHANGHSMNVAYEDIAGCLARIERTDAGTYLGARRPA